jgi:hypothetical protein
MVQYEIGTCYGCRKCMYCGCDLKVETCKCNKTIKPKKSNRTSQVLHSFGRNYDNSLNLNKKAFIQTQNALYSYNIDLKKKYTFTFCSTCNSSFQRLSNTKTNNSSQDSFSQTTSKNKNIIIIEDEFTGSSTITDNFYIDKFDENNDQKHEKNEEIQEKEISFTFIIKKPDGKSLPGKWLTFDVLTFEKFLIQIQKCVGSMVGVDDIDQTEYSLAFKPAKSNGEGLELSETKDFEKFLNEYEKLSKAKKEIVVIAKIASIKRKTKKKKRKV